ncbi:SulP family inorganic anion transporter [Pseudomonas sp. TNT2022 ID1048]|uniref:Sodium-independent anion transporter n=1 Tax=Pseudomonas protegens TaxID=380021 RepID=A0A9Q6N9Y9_9PSED|nr:MULTISPECIES: SulP family inorganic anion transporter [Pseudomonas]MCO7577369.1 SulP family inorganic anion transporter [Pseudomonas protegens]MCO7583915.1 SulP family inorganic anion transporter [Pseudomonas chlororaphis]MCO7600752.1 SulP family inorganic anion transporter [Pseudomonas chlororaphis]MDD1017455.1 SulP family inorganic anion transporter [Pseudomonas idahonensis]PYC41317.1 sodium-independent anion transporter [Pseudomonas protegens]
MIAIREAWKAGLLGPRHWARNLVAGVIVGVVALPLAMAFAIASGVKPEQGIYTAIIGGLLVSLFGGSRLQIAGPTGAFIVILAGVTAKYGVDGLQLATMMAGIILFLLGISRLGALIKFIPDPVILGFTAGIGVIIWVSQWKDFFGLPAVQGEHFHQKLWHLLQALPELHLATTLLALLSLALLLWVPKIPALKRLPAPLVAMVLATALQSLFQFQGVATIGSAFGGIPQGLPTLQLPEISLPRILDLIGPAFAIAMLGAIESLLSAVVADGMAGTRHDSNQELIGQGIANLATPLFGGFAATGAIARTATNIRNGGSSPLAGITHAVVLVLIILFLAPLAANIPLCALAAILFVVAYNMSELHHFKRMVQRAPRADVAILLCTFVLTVFSDLVIAVNIGVILAMLHFLRRMASSVEVQQVVGEDLENELRGKGRGHLPAGVLIYTIEGPLFFGAAETFERALAQTHSDPRLLIIRLKHVPFMDITGLQTLEEVIGQLHKRGIVVKLCEANLKVHAKLERVGILHAIGAQNYHRDLSSALPPL